MAVTRAANGLGWLHFDIARRCYTFNKFEPDIHTAIALRSCTLLPPRYVRYLHHDVTSSCAGVFDSWYMCLRSLAISRSIWGRLVSSHHRHQTASFAVRERRIPGIVHHRGLGFIPKPGEHVTTVSFGKQPSATPLKTRGHLNKISILCRTPCTQLHQP